MMLHKEPRTILIEGANQLSIHLDSNQIWMFETYTSLLLGWNKRINLTAITDPIEITVKHYLDSLTCLHAGLHENAKVIDVGTGAGFPGLPLKIARQDLDITLMDATRKKLAFLDAGCSELGFLDVKLLHARAEEAGGKAEHREKYDIVVSRAVGALNVLAEYCLPLVKQGGIMLAQKGADVKEELEAGKKALEALGGELENVIELTVPFSDYRRTLLMVRKKELTPERYPRTQAAIDRQPL